MVMGPGGLSWRAALLEAMSWLRHVLAPKLDALGDPVLEGARWEKYWCQWPGQWKSLLRTALKRDALAPVATRALPLAEQAADVVQAPPQPGQQLLKCFSCEATFLAERARATAEAADDKAKAPRAGKAE